MRARRPLRARPTRSDSRIRGATGTSPGGAGKCGGGEPVLTLPEAIRKMTSWPATRMRLTGRGSLKEGNWADVVVFDLATIQDKATYEQPMQYPAGIEYVVVNGQLVVDQGKHTGAKPGMVLYGPGHSAEGAAAAGRP